jgi:DNA-binding MarR family transcriptional regulator
VDSSRHEQWAASAGSTGAGRESGPVAGFVPVAGTSTGDPEQLADQLLETLTAAMRRVRRQMRRNSGTDLTVPQFRALRYVERHPGTDLSSLGRHLAMSPSSASALVERLSRSGHVVRSIDPDERRRIQIVLSAGGSEVIGRAVGLTRTWLASELERMSVADRRRLGSALDVLGSLGAEPSADPGISADRTR